MPPAPGARNTSRLKALLPWIGLTALLLTQAACSVKLPAPVSLSSDDWGTYQVQPPPGVVTRLVFAFGRPGDADLDASTQALAARGALVARVDVDRFARTLATRTDDCLYLAGMVEWHTNTLGRRFALADLKPPLLIGHGAGAGLVYALLAQAPPLAFAGGVTDPPPSPLAIPLPKPLCNLGAAPDSGGRLTLPAATLGAPWWVSRRVGAADNPLVAAVGARNVQNPVRQLPAIAFSAAAVRAFDAVQAASRPQSDSVSDLPLVELPASQATDTLAIIYSGDGGWRDLDRTLGGLLAEGGTAVVGVDALRYFWHSRSPEQTAADLTRILDHYRAAWGSRRIVLIGYSFGADILPAAYNRLSADRQHSVITLALLAPGRSADPQVSIAGWLGETDAKALPILPELQRIAPHKVLCIYGHEEQDETLCVAPGSGDITRIERPGDHHFDGRYDLIADAIRTQAAGNRQAPAQAGQ
jgi:type IV secretory pathway VirJ component